MPVPPDEPVPPAAPPPADSVICHLFSSGLIDLSGLWVWWWFWLIGSANRGFWSGIFDSDWIWMFSSLKSGREISKSLMDFNALNSLKLLLMILENLGNAGGLGPWLSLGLFESINLIDRGLNTPIKCLFLSAISFYWLSESWTDENLKDSVSKISSWSLLAFWRYLGAFYWFCELWCRELWFLVNFAIFLAI